jgi:hypothetical protein
MIKDVNMKVIVKTAKIAGNITAPWIVQIVWLKPTFQTLINVLVILFTNNILYLF